MAANHFLEVPPWRGESLASPFQGTRLRLKFNFVTLVLTNTIIQI